MNAKRWYLVCAVGILLMGATGCKFSFTTANISSLKISKDKAAATTASSFGPQDTIYAVAEVSNAPGKIKLKGRLLYDNVAGQTSGTLVPGLDKTLDLPGSGTGTYTFSPSATGWPNGSYKVEISMLTEEGEQKDQKTATFTISGNTETKTTTTTETTASPSTTNQAPASTENAPVLNEELVAGIWTLTGEGSGDPPLKIGPWQLSLDVKGTEVAGEVGDEDSTLPVSGNIDGKTLTITWGSGAAQFTLTGTLDKRGDLVGDFLTGTGTRGKWQAKKSS